MTNRKPDQPLMDFLQSMLPCVDFNAKTAANPTARRAAAVTLFNGAGKASVHEAPLSYEDTFSRHNVSEFVEKCLIYDIARARVIDLFYRREDSTVVRIEYAVSALLPIANPEP